MAFSFLTQVLGFSLAFATYGAAQLTGSLLYDGEETLAVTIENPSAENITMIGSNDLFDRLNDVPYAPFTLKNITGAPITLNVTRYKVAPLSDDSFSNIPPGGMWTRALNISNYLLGPPAGTSGKTVSQCFIASLAPSYYGLNTTGFQPDEALANYYLTKGLSTITVQSIPIHFNYSVPLDFTNDQAASIKADAAARLRQVGSGAGAGSTAISRSRRLR
ncbi:hypothetical protein G7Y79_00018g045450 [Physcia stellaris]|nr:hypothetical protein G7Y79_00018g045450 [Physcia stellaris]